MNMVFFNTEINIIFDFPVVTVTKKRTSNLLHYSRRCKIMSRPRFFFFTFTPILLPLVLHLSQKQDVSSFSEFRRIVRNGNW